MSTPEKTADQATNPWLIEDYDLAEYLRQIGVEEEPEALRRNPDLDLLTRLHEGHVRTFPFSNAMVLIGEHPGVAPETVNRSLLVEHHGGYCFEQAQLFAAVLERLGFVVSRHLGRVHSADNSRTHLAVLVELDGERWLCDPGFGFSLRRPMPLVADRPHVEGDRTFTLVRHGEGPSETWELLRDGDPQHFLDLLPVVPVDVRSGHLTTSTPGFGPFTDHLMVMRHTAEGHVTVTEAARTVRTPGKPTRREELDPEATADAVAVLGVELTDAQWARLVERIARLQESGD